MSLGRYIMSCEVLATELIESLSEEDIDHLWRLLGRITFEGWCRWLDENTETIAQFVSETPSQRQRKKWDAGRRELTLAAVQHCFKAMTFIEQAERLPAPGVSYRRMAAVAGAAYSWMDQGYDVQDYPGDMYWPFSFDWPFLAQDG